MTTILSDRPRGICYLTVTPDLLSGVLVDFLRLHFADEYQITDPTLKDYKYVPLEAAPEQQAWNRRNTEERRLPTLLIENIQRWTPSATNHAPAILVKRQAYQSQRISIADATFPRISVPDGYEPHYEMLAGSHAIVCLGSEAQAERLATEVWRELSEFSPIIRRELDLTDFRAVGYGELFRAREGEQLFGVMLTLGIIFEHAWVLRTEEPILQSVGVSAEPL